MAVEFIEFDNCGRISIGVGDRLVGAMRVTNGVLRNLRIFDNMIGREVMPAILRAIADKLEELEELEQAG